MDDKSHQVGPRVYIITAIISALAVMTAALLGNDTVINLLLRELGTKTITISANQLSSGTAKYFNGILTFESYNSIAGPGDADDDQLLRSFFSFYLGDTPKDAILIKAHLDIPYGIIGYPDNLGLLTLREYRFGQYGQQTFYGIPTSGWSVFWGNPADIMTRCRNISSCGTLNVSNDELRELVQAALPSRWAQFAFFFDSNLIIANQTMDAVVLSAPPRLVLKYYIPIESRR